MSRHLFFKGSVWSLDHFYAFLNAHCLIIPDMKLCTIGSKSMPVCVHCRPNQPDDVLTFGKNHLGVYKELPLLHNRLMHIPASACTCKPGLLARNPTFCTFCFDVIGAAPSSQASTSAFLEPVHFEQLGQIPSALLAALLVATMNAFMKKLFHDLVGFAFVFSHL